jgi:hypothetical protein
MSEIRVNAVKNTSGIERYLAQAWVNFNGTGTVAIRASGNVSSITDNGVGDYTVNFTTAMADANMSAVGSAGEATNASDVNRICGVNIYAANQARVTTSVGTTSAKSDFSLVTVAVFR